MRVRRDVASIPARSASETWCTIIDLVTADDSIDREQLVAAASIMESLIADEQPAEVPLVFKGSGTRVLVHCLYDEDAMEAGLGIGSLNSNPTVGEWCVTAPCEADDVDWMNKTLKERAPRITVHAADEAPVGDDDPGEAAKDFEIDWGGLNKP